MKARSLLNALRFAIFAKAITIRCHPNVPEAQWNPRLQQLNISGFSDPGVRSVHEVRGAKGSGIQIYSNANHKERYKFCPSPLHILHKRGSMRPQSIIFALFFVSSLAPRLTDAPQEFSMPSVMGLKLSPREMFEFQALVCGQVVGRPGLQWCAGCDTKSLQAI